MSPKLTAAKLPLSRPRDLEHLPFPEMHTLNRCQIGIEIREVWHGPPSLHTALALVQSPNRRYNPRHSLPIRSSG